MSVSASVLEGACECEWVRGISEGAVPPELSARVRISGGNG